MKRTIKDLAKLKGRVVLVRVDFNVPISDTGEILDTTRIVNALPTIKYLTEKKAKVVLMSHLGRPEGYDVRKSLWPIAMMLMKALPCNVAFCNSLIGAEVEERIKLMKEGNVLLLENTRFFEGEINCDMAFSREIAKLGHVFVNDAFGASHRKNATTYGVARVLPNAIGFLVENEIANLSKIMEEPKRPFVAVLGGAKVKTKVEILHKFIEKADVIIIGGAMAYTFLKAVGVNVGSSIVDKDSIGIAKEIIHYAQENGKKLLLPVDHVAIGNSDRNRALVTTKKLGGDLVAYDIGPATIAGFKKEIANAKQIFWNGPLGMFENEYFARGTHEIANAIANSKAHTIVGGGDTVAAINKYKLAHKISFISTGGGATMEFLEKGSLPCIDVIQERVK